MLLVDVNTSVNLYFLLTYSAHYLQVFALYCLSKVTVVDGPQGAAVVKNLSIHAVNSEEAAQALLAQGNAIESALSSVKLAPNLLLWQC